MNENIKDGREFCLCLSLSLSASSCLCIYLSPAFLSSYICICLSARLLKLFHCSSIFLSVAFSISPFCPSPCQSIYLSPYLVLLSAFLFSPSLAQYFSVYIPIVFFLSSYSILDNSRNNIYALSPMKRLR